MRVLNKYKKTDPNYSGDFKDQLAHGFGRLDFGDYGYYEGYFIEGKISGRGYLKVNNNIFNGSFSYIQQNNEWFYKFNGEVIYSSGEYYIGEVKNGKRDGLGKLFFKNKMVEGYFFENEYCPGFF